MSTTSYAVMYSRTHCCVDAATVFQMQQAQETGLKHKQNDGASVGEGAEV